MSADFWAILITGILSVCLTVAAQLFSAGKMRGEYGARLEAAESDIGELKEDRSKQWDEITDHGKKIAGLEATHRHRANGGVH